MIALGLRALGGLRVLQINMGRHFRKIRRRWGKLGMVSLRIGTTRGG